MNTKESASAFPVQDDHDWQNVASAPMPSPAPPQGPSLIADLATLLAEVSTSPAFATLVTRASDGSYADQIRSLLQQVQGEEDQDGQRDVVRGMALVEQLLGSIGAAAAGGGGGDVPRGPAHFRHGRGGGRGERGGMRHGRGGGRRHPRWSDDEEEGHPCSPSCDESETGGLAPHQYDQHFHSYSRGFHHGPPGSRGPHMGRHPPAFSGPHPPHPPPGPAMHFAFNFHGPHGPAPPPPAAPGAPAGPPPFPSFGQDHTAPHHPPPPPPPPGPFHPWSSEHHHRRGPPPHGPAGHRGGRHDHSGGPRGSRQGPPAAAGEGDGAQIDEISQGIEKL